MGAERVVGANAAKAARVARSASHHLPLTLTIGLGGWLLIYSGVKGDAPWDILLNIFRGEPLPGRLKSPALGSGVATGGSAVAGAVSAVGTGTKQLLWREPGHYDHLHWAHESQYVLLTVGRELQEKGYTVRGHPVFPPVGGHTTGSDHYAPCSCAIDVNWYPAEQEPAKLDEAERYIIKRATELTAKTKQPKTTKGSKQQT